MNEQESLINNNYQEIADCKEVELCGFFLVNDKNEAEWIDLSEVM